MLSRVSRSTDRPQIQVILYFVYVLTVKGSATSDAVSGCLVQVTELIVSKLSVTNDAGYQVISGY